MFCFVFFFRSLPLSCPVCFLVFLSLFFVGFVRFFEIFSPFAPFIRLRTFLSLLSCPEVYYQILPKLKQSLQSAWVTLRRTCGGVVCLISVSFFLFLIFTLSIVTLVRPMHSFLRRSSCSSSLFFEHLVVRKLSLGSQHARSFSLFVLLFLSLRLSQTLEYPILMKATCLRQHIE